MCLSDNNLSCVVIFANDFNAPFCNLPAKVYRKATGVKKPTGRFFMCVVDGYIQFGCFVHLHFQRFLQLSVLILYDYYRQQLFKHGSGNCVLHSLILLAWLHFIGLVCKSVDWHRTASP